MAIADELEEGVEPIVAPPPPDQAPGAPPGEDWRWSEKGKYHYVPRTGGKPGHIRRQGEETIEEARARDAAGREQRPRRVKAAKPKMPEAPKRLDSKELETSLTMALKAPGALAMTLMNDDWPSEHFNMTAPVLARQIILASEHNPWLRRRIEEAATGQDAMWAVISLVGVGSALFGYIVPPMIYFLNLPVPPRARERWGVPDRQPKPPYVASPPRPPQPQSTQEPPIAA